MRAISAGRLRFKGDGSKARRRNHAAGRSSTRISCHSNAENQGNRFERTGFTRRCWLAAPTSSISTCVPAGLIETAGACNQALSGRETHSPRPREASAAMTTRARTLSLALRGRHGDTYVKLLRRIYQWPLGPRQFLTQGADTRRYRCRSGSFTRNQHLVLSGAAQSNAGFNVRRPSLPARLLVLAGALAPKYR
jgi:hypothetical protein